MYFKAASIDGPKEIRSVKICQETDQLQIKELVKEKEKRLKKRGTKKKELKRVSTQLTTGIQAISLYKEEQTWSSDPRDRRLCP